MGERFLHFQLNRNNATNLTVCKFHCKSRKTLYDVFVLDLSYRTVTKVMKFY